MGKRGRHIGKMGEFFVGTDHGQAEVVGGQPTMVRMQGVPTMPGYRDRPGKWNALIPPFLLGLIEILKRWLA